MHAKQSQYNFGLIKGDIYATALYYSIATLQSVKKVVIINKVCPCYREVKESKHSAYIASFACIHGIVFMGMCTIVVYTQFSYIRNVCIYYMYK